MVQIILAESRLLFKKKTTYIVILIFAIFIAFMYFQKAINVDSGYYQKEIISPFYMIAFSGALMCSTCQIPMSILFGIIGAECFENNTCAGNVVTIGRVRFVLAKIGCIVITVIVTTCFLFFISIIEGMIINNSWNDFSLWLLMKYFLTTTFIALAEGYGAFFLAFLFRKSIIGIVGNIIIAYILSFLSGLIPSMYELLSGSYPFYIMANVFSILSERGDIQLVINVSNQQKAVSAAFVIICILALESIATVVISCKREYTS